MKKLSFFAAALLLLSVMANATIRRVGYNGVARTGVDYADIASAQTAAAVGDTIQIYGSQNGTITKRLVFIGFGYNFDANPNLQAIGGDLPSGANLTFLGGSDSSIVEGVDGSFTIGNTTSSTPVSKIIFRRCRGNIALENFLSPISDVKVISCAMYQINMNRNGATNPPVTNLQIINTCFAYVTMYLAGTSGSIINCVTPTNSYGGTISLSNAGFLVKNSIIANYPTTNSNTVYENNFFMTAQPATLPPGSNNRWGQVWANLFTRTAAGTDLPGYVLDVANFDEDYFVLKSGSLAINGGTDSGGNPTDAGIYGGDALFRYKLSGVPAVPAIYKLTAPSTAASANPYNITISVRSNN